MHSNSSKPKAELYDSSTRNVVNQHSSSLSGIPSIEIDRGISRTVEYLISIKSSGTVVNRMLFPGNIFRLLALNAMVLAVPSNFNPSPAVHEDYQPRDTRSSASPILVNNSITDTTDYTLPTIRFPEYNRSSNAEPVVFCNLNPPLPTPPIWGDLDPVECGLLLMTILADDSDLKAWQWRATYPLVLPVVWGISPGCKIVISAINPTASDYFQRAMIAQRAALIVSRCVNNYKGGNVSLGPREQFHVSVYADWHQGTA